MTMLHKAYSQFHAGAQREEPGMAKQIANIHNTFPTDNVCWLRIVHSLQFPIQWPGNQVANANKKLRDRGNWALCHVFELALSPNLPSSFYNISFGAW